MSKFLSALPLVRKTDESHSTVIELGFQRTIGGSALCIFAGPCSVESQSQMDLVGSRLHTQRLTGFRGGAYKPRTSPYAFQGQGSSGLEILSNTRRKFRMPIVTEVLSGEQIPQAKESADILQVGSRNMQNFELLKKLGRVTNPILLKRGFAATIDEFLFAAEYILNEGNPHVILCERGIRSFDSYTRNVVDLGAVAALKTLTHLPVIVDPSHATGRRELISPVAKGAIACGADGLIIECHPFPDQSVSDANQAISLEHMNILLDELHPIALAVGREMPFTPLGDDHAQHLKNERSADHFVL